MNERTIYDGFERLQKMFEEGHRETRELRQLMHQSFQELDRKFQETDRKFAETDRRFQETDRKFAETDRKFQETDRKFAETDRKFQETDCKFQETDRKLLLWSEETKQQFKETDKKIAKVSQEIGRLGGRWGDFIESMVKPAVLRLFKSRGLNVHEVHHNVTSQRDGLSVEIDLLVTNDDSCIAVEVKSFLSVDDIKEHKERLTKFKQLFPRYRDAKLMGAVAGAVIPDDVAKYAYRQGFFVLGQKGENMEILNNESFEPIVY